MPMSWRLLLWRRRRPFTRRGDVPGDEKSQTTGEFCFLSIQQCVYMFRIVGYKHLNYLQSCTSGSTIFHIYHVLSLNKIYITILCMYAKFWFRNLMQNYEQNYHSVLRIYIYHKKWQTHRYFNLEITMQCSGKMASF